jgi:hypothetical protein
MFELWSIKITICSFSELMLMGFISLLLTVFQDPISNICISKEIGESWLPCSHSETKKTIKETKIENSWNILIQHRGEFLQQKE